MGRPERPVRSEYNQCVPDNLSLQMVFKMHRASRCRFMLLCVSCPFVVG